MLYLAVWSDANRPSSAKEIIAEFTKFESVELDDVPNGAAMQQYLLEKTGRKTVPNIFIDQKNVGGCDDLKKLKSSGKLNAMLA